MNKEGKSMTRDKIRQTKVLQVLCSPYEVNYTESAFYKTKAGLLRALILQTLCILVARLLLAERDLSSLYCVCM